MSDIDGTQGPQKVETQTVRGLFKSFSETTTIHGVSRLSNSNSKLTSVYWLIIILTATGVSTFFAAKVVLHYLHGPYTNRIDIVTSYDIAFPAVTVCNMNRLRRSKLAGTRFQELVTIDGDLELKEYEWFFYNSELGGSSESNPGSPPTRRKRDVDDDHEEDEPSFSDFYDFWENIQDENNWHEFYKYSKLDDFSDIIYVVQPTKEEYKEYGHQAEDFILQCTFDKRKCNFT